MNKSRLVISLYKYAPKCYSELLATMGCLRIGTLYDYRRTEHKRGIADPTEGKKQVSHVITSLQIANSNDSSLKSLKDYRALDAFNAINIENSRNIKMKNIVMTRAFDAPDCYVYCLSSNMSSQMYQKFEGSDSCIEIFDVGLFLKYITQTLNCLVGVKFQGIYRVSYTERDQAWNGINWGAHPAFIKEPQFAHQAEFRAIWTPIAQQTIQPVVLGNFLIPSCCRKVELR